MSEMEEKVEVSSRAMLAFIGGAIVGTAAGLLLAPKPGKESREQLRKYMQKTREKFSHLNGQAQEVIQKTRGAIKEAVNH